MNPPSNSLRQRAWARRISATSERPKFLPSAELGGYTDEETTETSPFDPDLRIGAGWASRPAIRTADGISAGYLNARHSALQSGLGGIHKPFDFAQGSLGIPPF